MKTFLVVNPQSANGHTGRKWPEIAAEVDAESAELEAVRRAEESAQFDEARLAPVPRPTPGGHIDLLPELDIDLVALQAGLSPFHPAKSEALLSRDRKRAVSLVSLLLQFHWNVPQGADRESRRNRSAPDPYLARDGDRHGGCLLRGRSGSTARPSG